MTKKTNIFEKLNILLTAVFVFAFIVCYAHTSIDSQDYSITEEIEPYEVSKMADGSVEYYFNLTGYDYRYTGLMVYTSHQKLEAYSNGRLLYSFDTVEDIWGSTPGANYNFIEIYPENKYICIKVTPVYDVVADQDLNFYIGTTYLIYDELMTESMPKFLASVLLIIVSIIMGLYYSFMSRKQCLGKELLYLTFFTLFGGIWCANETDVISLLVQNRIVDAIIPYICLMMIVSPFVLFVDAYLNIKNTIFSKIIVVWSQMQAIVLTVLHFTKILEYRESLPAMQILLLVAIIYMVVAVMWKLFNGEFNRRTEICAIGFSLLLLAVVVDLKTYYTSLGDADKIGRYTFLIFVLLLSWDMIKTANEIIVKGRRAKQLEVFALTDSMTGLFNRNAYESHAKAEKKLSGVTAIVADVNGLKKCNDTYGHEAGDTYITLVAEAFGNVFSKYGNCYRTGGDEFCCIIRDGREINIERLQRLFMTKIFTLDHTGQYPFKISVAVGSAEYDSRLDSDFRAIVNRADENMYEIKKEMHVERG